MNIVLITTGKRLALLEQSLFSLRDNADNWKSHHLTIVWDGESCDTDTHFMELGISPNCLIINPVSQGASAARNIGASSIPKYRRGDYVMFCDDDVYFCPKWDEKMIILAESVPNCILSGHAHPFNHGEPECVPEYTGPSERGGAPPDSAIHYGVPLVISTPHFMMPWSLWDDVGYFVEPGGAGGSEDYDYCMRAKAKGYGFAVSEPQCVIHCGITSSNGNPIVGQKEVIENNCRLEEIHGIVGKVKYP